ncbi:hypothetical protein [Paenibacillus periandrae]|uniref:hypothetical protein n=1 Tax=Paenibacillus periandrae TaxID=1761741 RepID=UPI001F08A562|nr:hypothetical protein [Paenibacillus periandrae]
MSLESVNSSVSSGGSQLWKAVYCGAVDFEPVRANKNRFLRNQILLYAEARTGCIG